MSELERLLHNLVSATANVATATVHEQIEAAGEQRDKAVSELAAYLEQRKR